MSENKCPLCICRKGRQQGEPGMLTCFSLGGGGWTKAKIFPLGNNWNLPGLHITWKSTQQYNLIFGKLFMLICFCDSDDRK